jgi:16S rRNA (guanine1207-N2)-methyltransferase
VTGSSHYFAAQPDAAHRPGLVRVVLPDLYLELATDSGVFSPGRLDPGTRFLLEKAPPPPASGDILDLGCGYGPIACVLASVAPRATVYAVDVNTRALELTRTNAAAIDAADRIVVAEPDQVPASVRFAQIWSNPPIRIGKADLHELLRRWLPRLASGGTAWLVVARHLGGDSLADWLRAEGWTVERHASQQGFRVLRVTNSGDGDPGDEGDS